MGSEIVGLAKTGSSNGRWNWRDCCATSVLRRQDFRAPQIFVGVNVLGFSGLLFARAFLTRSFGYVLGASRPALCRAEKQAGAKNDAEAAAKRLP